MNTAPDALAVGQTFALGAYEFTAERIKDFAIRYDPQLFHIDEEAAIASAFGALCASGWHTVAVAVRLQADHFRTAAAQGEPVPRFGLSPGFNDLRWLKPVYAGDRVAYSGSITAKRQEAGRTIVSLAIRGDNQTGETVLTATIHVPVQA